MPGNPSIGSQKFVTRDIVANFCVNPVLKPKTVYRRSTKVGTGPGLRDGVTDPGGFVLACPSG